MTEGRPPKPAAVAVTVALGSALGGHAEPAAAAYANADAAREAAMGLAGRGAAAAAERYAGSVRLQALAGQVRDPRAPPASRRLPLRCDCKPGGAASWMRRGSPQRQNGRTGAP